MVEAYHIGLLTTDSLSGIRCGYVASADTTREAFTDCNTRAAFVVTTGKTFKIYQVTVASSHITVNYAVTIMYDDDGAGTNEVSVFTIPAIALAPYTIPVNISIPADKHLTAKTATSAVGYVVVVGVEV